MAGKKAKQLTLEKKLQNALVPKEEQPYKIPNNWCWVRLDFLLKEICNGTTIKQNKEGKTARVTRIESLQNNTIDFNRIGNIVNESLIKDKDWYIEGDIIVSHINSIEHVGKSAVITRDMLPLVHGMNLLRLRLNNICNSQFFQLYTRTTDYKKSIVNRVNRAVNQVSINQKQLCSLEIPITNLKEQQRIVNKIESLFNKLDKAKELIEHTLNQIEQNKMAILHKAFTGELTAKWRKENNIDETTFFNKVKLKNVIKLISGRDVNVNLCNDKSIGIPYILGASNIKNNTFFVERWIENPVVVSEKNDILLSVKGTIGKLYLQKEEKINISRQIMALRALNELNIHYLYYFLLKECERLKFEGNGLIPGISRKDILNLNILVPTIEEQQEIVNILDKLLAKYNKIQNLNKQLEQIELLKKSILAKAFRGELGTNDPQEESAEKLLAEILAEN